MKILATFLAFAYLAPATASAAETPDLWHNRPRVIVAAERLAKEIEHFDETMHDAKAPAHVIQKVHHFEETVSEFVIEVRHGIAYQHAYNEFQHIREDIKMIRSELYKHPHLMTHGPVAMEWAHVWSSYRKLDHEMFHHLNQQRLSEQEVAKLDAEIAAVDAAH